MEPHQTAASYNKLAATWAGNAIDPNNGIAQHERAIRFTRNARLAIDIGCGSNGRIIDLLLQRGFSVEGVDISPGMLDFARKRHPNVAFYEADICTWGLPRKYDLISAWDSIWHVPLDRQCTVIGKLCAALSPGGVLIFTTGGVDTPEETTNQSCYGQRLYHAAPGIPHLLRLTSMADCIIRHLEYDQYPELHLCVILQKS